jgi:hypothetical protein
LGKPVTKGKLPNIFFKVAFSTYSRGHDNSLKSAIIADVAPVAQLDRAFVFGTKGWEFEPLQEHLLFNLQGGLKVY